MSSKSAEPRRRLSDARDGVTTLGEPGTTRLPRVGVDLGKLCETQRLEFARMQLGGVYDLELPAANQSKDPGFFGTTWRYDNIVASVIDYHAHVTSRSARQCRADQIDHYQVAVRLQGYARCDNDGVRQTQGPGDILLSDMSRPQRYDFDPGSRIILFVPRETLDEALPRPLDLHGLVPCGTGAALLAEHLQALVRYSDELTLDVAPAIARATVELLTAALLPLAHDTARPGGAPRSDCTLLRQISRYIDLHLNEPELSAAHIAAAFQMSRSTLYRLFEALGGVARYIKERRLERVYEILSSGATQRAYIGRLAQDHGFRGAAHFSRAFRECYGCSPQDVRNGAQASPMPNGRLSMKPTAITLNAWLRSLRD